VIFYIPGCVDFPYKTLLKTVYHIGGMTRRISEIIGPRRGYKHITNKTPTPVLIKKYNFFTFDLLKA